MEAETVTDWNGQVFDVLKPEDRPQVAVDGWNAPVELDMVEIDDLEVHNVAAVVLPPDVLNESLLGLSFLSRLRRFEYADGKLVLEQ